MALDEIWDLIESVFEGFLTYSWVELEFFYDKFKFASGLL